MTPTGNQVPTAGSMPAEEVEQFFANREAVYPRVQAYYHGTVYPAWKAASGAVNHWVSQRRAVGGNVAGVQDRLNTLVRVMGHAQSSAEIGYAGFGSHQNAMEEQVRALQELRAHLANSEYRGAEDAIRALDSLEATMRPRMMDRGIYG